MKIKIADLSPAELTILPWLKRDCIFKIIDEAITKKSGLNFTIEQLDAKITEVTAEPPTIPTHLKNQLTRIQKTRKNAPPEDIARMQAELLYWEASRLRAKRATFNEQSTAIFPNLKNLVNKILLANNLEPRLVLNAEIAPGIPVGDPIILDDDPNQVFDELLNRLVLELSIIYRTKQILDKEKKQKAQEKRTQQQQQDLAPLILTKAELEKTIIKTMASSQNKKSKPGKVVGQPKKPLAGRQKTTINRGQSKVTTSTTKNPRKKSAKKPKTTKKSKKLTKRKPRKPKTSGRKIKS